MKKVIALLLVLTLLAGVLAGCGSDKTGSDDAQQTAQQPSEETEQEPIELVVFAAASMTETLTEIQQMYKEVAPEVSLSFNFDSSGTLKTQIEEGAECDVFISAGQKQMDQLDKNADASVNADGLDFVLEGSRFDILENKVTLCVPDGQEDGVTSFDDMAQKLQDGSILMAMGNEDVPVGQYTQKILAYYGLDEATLASAGNITYASNVKEVTTQISEAAVDCGVIYCTDAYSAGLKIVDEATAEMCGQVIYPAAVINTSKHAEAAQAFLDYLKTAEASAVFEEVGFTALSK